MVSSLSSTPGKSMTSIPSMTPSRLYRKGIVVRFTAVVPTGTWREVQVVFTLKLMSKCKDPIPMDHAGWMSTGFVNKNYFGYMSRSNSCFHNNLHTRKIIKLHFELPFSSQ